MEVSLLLDPSNPSHKEFLKWKETASQDEVIKALLIGHFIFTNVQNKEVDIVSIKKEIEKEYQERISTIKEHHRNDIEHYQKKLIEQYDTLSQKYLEYVNNAKDREIIALKQQLKLLENTNSFKGEKGELMVKDILHKHFLGYEIIDTSSQSNMSDIHLRDRNGNIVVIECKNKNTITSQDVQKSLNDIQHLKKHFGARFVGYLFVSVRSANIPKKGDLHYEVIDSIPTIWYGIDTLENSEIVNLIRILYMHQDTIPEENELMTCINTYLEKISDMKKNVDTVSKNVQSLKTTIDWLYEDIFKLVGRKKKTFVCPHCEMEYKRKGDLDKHVNSKHPSC